MPPQALQAVNKRYSFTDQHPLAGKDFYRLLIKDVDGKKQYSKFVLIRLDNLNSSVQVFPNPAADHLQVQIPVSVKGRMVIQVADGSGKVVRTLSFEATGNMLATTINISGLSRGLIHAPDQGAAQQLTTSFLSSRTYAIPGTARRRSCSIACAAGDDERELGAARALVAPLVERRVDDQPARGEHAGARRGASRAGELWSECTSRRRFGSSPRAVASSKS